MERMLRLLGLAVLALIAAPEAKADWRIIDCTGCSTWQMEETVKYSGDGPYAVYDAAAGIVKYYQVNGWGDSEIEFGAEAQVIEWAPPPGTDHYAAVMKNFYQVYGAPMTMSADLNINDVRQRYPDIWNTSLTAYDVISDINLRSGIADRLEYSLTNEAATQSAMSQFLEMVRNLFGGNAPVNINIKLKMDDGSTVQYKKDSPSSNWNYVKGSARFSNGSVVPELGARDNHEYAGTWVFHSDTSVDDFWAAMQDIGARLNNVGGGSDQTTIVCQWRPTEGILYCERQL